MNDQDTKKLIGAMKDVFATKEDMTTFATKDDLKKFATKEDVAKLATKKDLSAVRKDIKEIRSEISKRCALIMQILKEKLITRARN